jgi:hypothetical protein
MITAWPLSPARRCSTWPAVLLCTALWTTTHGMTDDTIASLRQDTRNLFYHGYTNYMNHAFPEDELRPISCKPQTRNRENPADIGLNDVLGNYSVTLVDSLSTLAILASGTDDSDGHKPLRDFQQGVEALVELYGDGGENRPCGSKTCGFELDSKVQVFETNIRGVGGLLSAHLFAAGELPIRGYEPDWYIHEDGILGVDWEDFVYDGQLLRLAYDLATRLLPAFDTPTGLPYPRVNLKYGIPFYRDSEHGVCRLDGTSTDPREITETCAAGAGSLVLEFTTLSRLTGDLRFEKLAKQAFWAVWERRSAIGLIGNGLDAETGQWTLPPLAGIGAGVDSFFEYALKSSILLSGLHEDDDHTYMDEPESFLQAWQQAHAAVKRHVYRASSTEKHPYYGQADLVTGAPRYTWIDNLSAYYPGLLTLAGELDEAISSHLLFAALWTRYAALPERWHASNSFIDPNFRHWAGRPEFIESSYYLYQATKDPFYLHVGEMTLRDIRRRCWTRCGWADLGDVISGEQRDRMESFFLGETAKYLYLLFEQDHPLNRMDAPVVFTTEGHPLLIPSALRKKAVGHGPTRTTAATAPRPKIPAPAPTCPAHVPAPPFTGSAIVSRPDFFHAAAMARLHLVPVEASRSSALQEASEHSPGISLADVQSPTNYTYYPWTLPQELVPAYGVSAPMMRGVISTLTFPNLNADGEQVGMGMGKGMLPLGSLQKVLEGVVISSLSNLRLNMVQEARSLLLPDPEMQGGIVEKEIGLQYRVQGIANWALGRDEKVILAKEALDGVAAGDPNFKRVKDLEMLDLIVDYSPPLIEPLPISAVAEDDFEEVGNENGIVNTSSLLSRLTTFLSPSSSAPPQPQPTLHRTLIAAILPTGIGAAPLPLSLDSNVDAFGLPLGSLPQGRIYFLDDTLCTHTLPAKVAKEYQVLVLKRGGCAFNAKLANIPALAPTDDGLQLVVVLSTPEESEDAGGGNGAGLIRPLLDEVQRTPNGLERRYPIAIVMVESSEEVEAVFRGAASVVASSGESRESLEEVGPGMEAGEERHGPGLGIKRRYWFESMGLVIGNVIAL